MVDFWTKFTSDIRIHVPEDFNPGAYHPGGTVQFVIFDEDGKESIDRVVGLEGDLRHVPTLGEIHTSEPFEGNISRWMNTDPAKRFTRAVLQRRRDDGSKQPTPFVCSVNVTFRA